MHDIKSFLKSINFDDENNLLNDVTIEKVVLNKKSETFSVYLKSENVLPYDIIDKLISGSYLINGKYKCNIYITYVNITDEDLLEYVKIIMEKLVEKKPSLISLLESIPVIDDDIIIF